MKALAQIIWPPLADGDILRAARKRLVNMIALTVALLGAGSATMSFSATFAITPLHALIGVIGPLLLFGAPLALHYTGNIRAVSGVMLVGLYGLILMQTAAIGGAANPAIFYFAGLPVLTAFLIGYRTSVCAAIIVILTGFALFGFYGYTPDAGFGPAPELTAFWNTVVLTVTTAALGACTALFQREMENANRKLDEARRAADIANQTKSDFIASISHEIRTPMNGVLGMAELLRGTQLDDNQRQMVGVLNDTGETLMRLISDLLDLSKVEAGRLQLETIDFDLVEQIEQVARLHQAEADAKGVELSLDIDPAARALFRGDPTRIRQILSNLLSNAVKFTAKGAVSVRVSASRAAPGRTQLVLEVADTGCGVTPETQAALFEPFTQADASISRTHGGTGLGLTICRELCELMSGDIGVVSQPGRGATFTARFEVGGEPAVIETEPAPAAAPSASVPAENAAPAPAAHRVLLVDDNAVNRQVACAFLAEEPVDVTTAADGEAAIEAWETGLFDIILMDICMPVMDGLEAAREIRLREGVNGRRTPIFAVTANAMEDQVAEYLAGGMDGVVAKPVTRAGLKACLTRAVELRDHQGPLRRKRA